MIARQTCSELISVAPAVYGVAAHWSNTGGSDGEFALGDLQLVADSVTDEGYSHPTVSDSDLTDTAQELWEQDCSIPSPSCSEIASAFPVLSEYDDDGDFAVGDLRAAQDDYNAGNISQLELAAADVAWQQSCSISGDAGTVEVIGCGVSDRVEPGGEVTFTAEIENTTTDDRTVRVEWDVGDSRTVTSGEVNARAGATTSMDAVLDYDTLVSTYGDDTTVSVSNARIVE